MLAKTIVSMGDLTCDGKLMAKGVGERRAGIGWEMRAGHRRLGKGD